MQGVQNAVYGDPSYRGARAALLHLPGCTGVADTADPRRPPRSPNRTSVLARPIGFKPTRTHADEKSIPIEGADVWEVATMRSA